MIDNIKRNGSKISSVIYMGSSIITFGLAFLINVVLTNYSINDAVYGQYKYATNFILTIPAIFSMGITWSCASLIAKKDVKNKDGIMTVSVLYTIAIGILVTLGLYIAQRVFEVESLSGLEITFPFVIIFLLQKLVNQIYTGMGQALKLSLYNVAPNVIIMIGLIINIIVFDKLNYKYATLLYLLSYLVIIIPKLATLNYKFTNLKDNSYILIKDLKSNGFKVHISSVFTTSSTQIIALVCGNIYGYSEYGYYSLAASLAIIFQLIGSSFAVVNFKHYANVERIEKKDLYFMIGLGGFAYICMIILIDIVFFWFYPRNFAPTISYLKILCFSNMIFGFTSLFNRFFIGKGLGGKVMKNSFITAVATVLIDIPMILIYEMKGMAVASIIVSFICLGSYIYDYKKYRQRLQ